MGKHHWKIEKQPEWYVKAVRKTIAALPGGYAEAAAAAFEEKYGSQLELIFRFIDRALATGVLA